MKKNIQLTFYALMGLFMLLTTVWASLQQNLFTEFSFSSSPMWFKATLIDFYINQLIIWIVSCYFVKSLPGRLTWLVIFITLGSMGTCAFAIISILQNRKILIGDKL